MFLAAFAIATIAMVGSAQAVPAPGTVREAPAISVEPVRAVYLTSGVAAGRSFDHFLDLLETSEVNALVIDLKDANGRLAFAPPDPALRPFVPDRPTIPDLADRIRQIHERNGYAIARLPVFQDTWYAERKPAEALKRADGSLWRDGIGGAWLDPASTVTWEYTIAVARSAAAIGFDEINLDYIRFPSDGPGFTKVRYPRWDGKATKRSVIRAFAQAMDSGVRQRGIPISADLFGLVFWANNDLGIGQYLEDLAPHFDILSPMVYPSHYAKGFIGKANPAQYPYEVIASTLRKGRERLGRLPVAQRPVVRPWFQDFQLGARYGVREVQLQQKAGRDTGAIGWMMWNPRGRYSEGAFGVRR